MSLADFFADTWDAITDGVEYLFSFEWFGDAWEGIGEFFSSMFDNLNEFSFLGLAFSMLAVGFIYSTRYINIDGSGMGSIEAMTQFMPTGQRLVWTVLSYAGVALGGYMMGKYFENT